MAQDVVRVALEKAYECNESNGCDNAFDIDLILAEVDASCFEELVKANAVLDGWVRFDDCLPPDNKDVLVGKCHDDFGWYWIVQGSFEDDVFYLNLTDDEFKLQTEEGFQKPTHWVHLPALPTLEKIGK